MASSTARAPATVGRRTPSYVGTLKGGGRIYQQTFIDTYAKSRLTPSYTIARPRSPRPRSSMAGCLVPFV